MLKKSNFLSCWYETFRIARTYTPKRSMVYSATQSFWNRTQFKRLNVWQPSLKHRKSFFLALNSTYDQTFYCSFYMDIYKYQLYFLCNTVLHHYKRTTYISIFYFIFQYFLMWYVFFVLVCVYMWNHFCNNSRNHLIQNNDAYFLISIPKYI